MLFAEFFRYTGRPPCCRPVFACSRVCLTDVFDMLPVRLFAMTHTHTRTHIDTHTHTHTGTQARTHTHTHAHTHRGSQPPSPMTNPPYAMCPRAGVTPSRRPDDRAAGAAGTDVQGAQAHRPLGGARPADQRRLLRDRRRRGRAVRRDLSRRAPCLRADAARPDERSRPPPAAGRPRRRRHPAAHPSGLAAGPGRLLRGSATGRRPPTCGGWATSSSSSTSSTRPARA